MFDLARNRDDLRAHVDKVWDEQGDMTIKRPPTNFGYVMRYPLLLSSAVSVSHGGDEHSFVHIVCGRKDAKTLVYPKTNMLNRLGSAGFIHIKDIESAKHALDALKDSADRSSALQRALISEAEHFMDTNGYPMLYTHRTYRYRNSMIERPFVLSVAQAKELVYANKSRKKKKMMGRRRALTLLSDSATLMREDNGDFSILVNMSYNTRGIIRFTYMVEKEIQRKEYTKLETIRIELTRADRQASPGSNTVTLAKEMLDGFNNWRKGLRAEYTSRMPDEVLADPTHYRDGYITGTNIREE